MAPPKRNPQPATRGRLKRQARDRHEEKHRRRASDARWRAEMANYFDALRYLLPPSSSRHDRRVRSKSDILDVAAGHVHYLEGVVSKLLAKKRKRHKREPRDLEGVRAAFLNGSAGASFKLPKASRHERKSSVQEPASSPGLPEERDPAIFTALRESPVPNHADALSASSSPTACDSWPSDGIDEAVNMSSPTMKSLLETFCENLSAPEQELCNVQVAPADKGVQREALIPSGRSQFIAGNVDSAELIRAEDPVLSSAATSSTSQNQSPHSLQEPWILDSQAWILDDFKK